jgi:2-phospho-L-lactate guanylyltransferase
MMLQGYHALVPVKTLTAAKGRLAPYLTPPQRARLVLAMLQHVVETLRDSHLLEQITVVSSDAAVQACALQWGVRTWPEAVAGHNPALQAAAERALAEGATALLTISADLPLLTIADLQALVEHAQRYAVVLAPAHDGHGTNALLLRPPLALPYLFGEESLQRYRAAARQRDLAFTCCQRRGLALDIDTIHDLRQSGFAYEILAAGPL